MRNLVFLLFLPLFLDAQIPAVSAGQIVRHENFASRFVAPRHVDVWLPPGYSPRKKYPVLYMHDGQMLFDSTQTWNRQEWGVDETLTRLFSEKKVPPCIVVGIWNTPLRREEYYPAKAFYLLAPSWQDSLRKDLQKPDLKPLSDDYLRFVVSELKPFIEKNYAVRKGRRHTLIAGSSMGGLISMYAICEYPRVFGGAACLSTHWPGSFREKEMAFSEGFRRYLRAKLPSPRKHKIYFDFGTAALDAWYEPHQILVDEIMLSGGFTAKNWTTRKFVGADHSERAWQQRLGIPLEFLMK